MFAQAFRLLALYLREHCVQDRLEQVRWTLAYHGFVVWLRLRHVDILLDLKVPIRNSCRNNESGSSSANTRLIKIVRQESMPL
jgi:hypothetical protein